MYTVTVGEKVDQYKTRAEAVAAARQMSKDTRRTLNVQDDKGREFMTYKNGQLQSYEMKTSHRRRR